MATFYSHRDSSLGRLLLRAQDSKLDGLFFADESHAPQIETDWIRDDDADIFTDTMREVNEYLEGERREFTVSAGFWGTPFQGQVWREIAAIPYGETVTYSDLAERLGSPGAVRAVGVATGRNPLSLIIPCHRVIGKDGTLTGYAGGMDRKRRLLSLECSTHLQLAPA